MQRFRTCPAAESNCSTLEQAAGMRREPPEPHLPCCAAAKALVRCYERVGQAGQVFGCLGVLEAAEVGQRVHLVLQPTMDQNKTTMDPYKKGHQLLPERQPAAHINAFALHLPHSQWQSLRFVAACRCVRNWPFHTPLQTHRQPTDLQLLIVV